MTTRSQLRDRALGRRSHVALTVYGTIVVMATIAAESPLEPSPRDLAELVIATVTVIWLAHFYAETLAESIRRGGRLHRDDMRALADRELSIVRASATPVFFLILGAAGAIDEVWAIRLAFAAGLATLAVQGVRFARQRHLSRRRRAAAVAINLTLGLVIVGLKSIVPH